jgi:peptidyl-prolyl cis-trans isomerase D
MLNAGSSLMRPSQMKIAEINGKSVQYPDFQKKIEKKLLKIYKMNSGQDPNWTTMPGCRFGSKYGRILSGEAVMSDVYDELGLTVSSDELFDI